MGKQHLKFSSHLTPDGNVIIVSTNRIKHNDDASILQNGIINQ